MAGPSGDVWYTVPVCVRIEDGEIIEVKVMDEAIQLDDDENDDEALVEIADDADEWPQWVIG